MSKVTINVNNKAFTIACDDGQEERVQQLGRYVDERFRELNQAGAAPTESYTLVLTALVIADDMFEARDAAEKATMAQSQMQARQQPAGPSAQEMQQQFQQQYDAMRGQYEDRIARLEAELEQARRAAAQSAGNVTDLTRIRAEADAALKAREAEIAQAVDKLTDKLETVVKKLKRA